jgi:hypothetical protein
MAMSQNSRIDRPSTAHPKLTGADLPGKKKLEQVLGLLRRLRPNHDHPQRELHYDEYAAYLLLYFFTPLLQSMRGMQFASSYPLLKQRFGLDRFSLGSFSEAGRVFDPKLLAEIVAELGQQVIENAHPHDPRMDKLDRCVTAVDGTLIEALPRMVWALWLDSEHRAAKVHLQYSILKGIPVQAMITEGSGSELTVLGNSLAEGLLYVLDRGYACYDLLSKILLAGSSFVVRIRANASYKILQELPLSEQARKAGIQFDRIVELGTDQDPELHGRRLRIIQIHREAPPDQKPRTWSKNHSIRKPCTDTTLLLCTDLLEIDADLIALIYQDRWQIELFFRWFKKVLGADHLLSLCANGLTIVTYCALIASVLMVLWTGRKPTRRTHEALCFYFLGLVSEDDLLDAFDRAAPAR